MFLLQEVKLRAEVTNYYKLISIKNHLQVLSTPLEAVDTQFSLDSVLGLKISRVSETPCKWRGPRIGRNPEGGPASAVMIEQAATHDYRKLYES